MQRWARDTVHRAFTAPGCPELPSQHDHRDHIVMAVHSPNASLSGGWHKLQPFLTVPLTLVNQRHCGVIRSSLQPWKRSCVCVCEIYTSIYFIHINIYKHRCGLIICEYIFAYINSYTHFAYLYKIITILNKFICCKDKYMHLKYIYKIKYIKIYTQNICYIYWII